MSKFSQMKQAVKMAREMWADAKRMKHSNPQGAKDRNREGDHWRTRALILAGRVK